MALDLALLEKGVDIAIDKETPASFTEWLINKRIKKHNDSLSDEQKIKFMEDSGLTIEEDVYFTN